MGNIRVISDRGNRLKSNRSLDALLRFAEQGPSENQAEYRMVAEYVAREELLRDVRLRAVQSRRDSALPTLDRIFAVGLSSTPTRCSGQQCLSRNADTCNPLFSREV